jgi:signal transduction histidine kinase
MMAEIFALVFFLISLGLFAYLRREKQQQKEWINQLKRFHAEDHEHLFSKQGGASAEIAFELNRIVGENQEEIRQYKKKDQANRMLLTSLSHDVRTPLASLLGYLEALEKGILDEQETKEYISVAYRKASDLHMFTDTLFDWFKLNSQEQQYKMENVDINELTRLTLVEWLPMLDQSQIELTIDIPDEENILSLDPFAYTRIINNLLQNAITHGQCSKVSISIKRNENCTSIYLGNNGNVIPSDQLPYIFDRLYKGDASRTDRGSGLGLAIVNELVRGMGGSIDVPRSDETETVFQINFPH